MQAALALAMAALKEVVTLIVHLRNVAQQTGEMTPEEDAAYDAELNETMNQLHWKIE